jgi:hypothetical protein
MGNAAIALQAAATALAPFIAVGKTPKGYVFAPVEDQIMHLANNLKVWLDHADSEDARAAKSATKGTLEDRVDALESRMSVTAPEFVELPLIPAMAMPMAGENPFETNQNFLSWEVEFNKALTELNQQLRGSHA